MYESQAGSDAGMGIFPIIFFVAVYVYFAYTQARMADRIGMSKYAWWAYVPILNLFLLFRMASKPAWWFVLCLVPLVNIVVFAVLWMEVAKAVRQSPVWGILVLVPAVNFIALGIMAFANPPQRVTPQPPSKQPEESRQQQSVG